MIKQEIQFIEHYYQVVSEYLMNYSMQLVGAILVLLFGLWVAKKLSSVTVALMNKHNIDVTLTNFISNVVKVIVIVMFVVISLGKIGISVTPFVAAIGAASLGAGLAMQGMLSNYGAGLAIIATRPFVVGDTIMVNGISGLVKDIQLGHTILIDEEQVEITIPNKQIIGEVLHNSFANSLVKGEVGIAYHADHHMAVKLIQHILSEHPNVANEPENKVGIEAFADSAVMISYRYWVPTNKIIETKLAVNSLVFDAINNAKIEIPFPQRVVTLKNPT
ncbi:mechanosensitive ion channel family protein [Pseudoalteromonas xiamenensis]|uniref:Small-conductance mechanosensitive channel n=1 Tax=Pseudoalteromonas xiamenensis TaxID=882626 RepID=A0A975DFS9_9GAMM|nr:mechanosensitive ion channel domain-containing protein [Pseudoalteromonas xiamenensis]QTH70983.1 mechanosensitive ion channel [Pseudoalteromonas xiamenensis]